PVPSKARDTAYATGPPTQRYGHLYGDGHIAGKAGWLHCEVPVCRRSVYSAQRRTRTGYQYYPATDSEMTHKKAQKAQEVFFVVSAFLWLVFPRAEPLRFEVTTNFGPASGRLFIILSSSNRPEPRLRVGETGMQAAPILGRDVKNFGPGIVAAID